jgi:uncharacterized membrane-anchored protein YhcB (DUF1043 family)
MEITAENLTTKLKEIHPEIETYGLGLAVHFDTSKQAWVATFSKDEHTLQTHMEKKDVENCMNNVQCVYVGVQLGQFIKNYCEGGQECKV